MLKIEDGIPIPTQTARKGTNIEQLRAMKVGQSVFFDAPIAKRATRFYRVAKKLGAKIVIRKDGDGQRLWLTGLPGAAVKENSPIITQLTKTTKKKVVKKAKKVVVKKKSAPKTAPKKKAKFVPVRPPRDPSKPTREQLRALKRTGKAAAKAAAQGLVNA